jgi:copper oxidase (laccase) domain-containing protein
MKAQFHTRAPDLYIALGPAIRSCCYEVGGDFGTLFPGGIIKKNGRFYLDLIAANKKQLLAEGVGQERIYDTGICTSCSNNEFFSYRKEGKSCGRMISVIMLK